MQYRGWMPAMAMERYQKGKYDYTLDEIHVGRYQVVVGEVIGNGILPGLKRAAELATTLGIDGITFNKFGLTKPNKEISRKYFNEFRLKRPADYDALIRKYESSENPQEAAFEEWMQTRKDQLQATAAELRSYILFLGAALGLAFSAGEDEVREHPGLRFAMKALDRVQMELGFFFSVPETMKILTRSPMAVIGLINDAYRFLTNTVEETRDFALGAESDKTIKFLKPGENAFEIDWMAEVKDRTPRGKYMFKLVPGVRGITNWLEFTEDAENKTTMLEWLFGGDTVYKR
jgi:hypothetical protein